MYWHIGNTGAFPFGLLYLWSVSSRVIKEKQAKEEELKSKTEVSPSSTVQLTDELPVTVVIKDDRTGETVEDGGRILDITDNTVVETAEKSKTDISQTLADSGIVDEVSSSTDSQKKAGFIGNSNKIEKNTADMPSSVQDEKISQVAGSDYDNFVKQANNNLQDIQQDSKISVSDKAVTETSTVNRAVHVLADSSHFSVRYTSQLSVVSDRVDGMCASSMKQDLDDSLVMAMLPVDMKPVSPEADRTWSDSISASDSEGGRDACPLHPKHGLQSTRYVCMSVCGRE